MIKLLFMHLSTEIPIPPPQGQGGDLTSCQLKWWLTPTLLGHLNLQSPHLQSCRRKIKHGKSWEIPTPQGQNMLWNFIKHSLFPHRGRGWGGGVGLSVDKCIIILCFIVTLPPAPNILSGLRQENFVVVSSSYCLITVVASSTDPT